MRPSAVGATPMNRLAAGVVVAAIVAVSITLSPWVPPLSDVTTILDWSGVGTSPSGKRRTSAWRPAGVIFHPCGLLSPVVGGALAASAVDPATRRPRAAATAMARRAG